jgi:predicted DCC family thiol-disulfide oxidoreductase YuxK
VALPGHARTRKDWRMGQPRDIQTERGSAAPAHAGADFLLYDGACPACSAYVAMSRLRRLYPALRVVSARSDPALVARLRAEGYEINEGMVLSLGGAIHFGPEATRMIAVLGRASPSRWRRAALACFGTAPWAGRLYPWLNRTRGLLLRLLGRRLID